MLAVLGPTSLEQQSSSLRTFDVLSTDWYFKNGSLFFLLTTITRKDVAMSSSTRHTLPVLFIITCFVLSFWALISHAQEPMRDRRIERIPQRIAQRRIDPIGEKETELRTQGFPLGRPLDDQHVTEDGGRFRAFESGSIYWSEATGAHIVYGLIGAKWAEMGSEKSPLGYPLTDELPGPQPNVGRFNDFQHGMIRWTPDQGVSVLYDAMLLRRAAIGDRRGTQSPAAAQSDEPV